MPVYTWRAINRDGSVVQPPASVDHIDRKKVGLFQIFQIAIEPEAPEPSYLIRVHEGAAIKPVVTLHIEPGMRLIYRQRTIVSPKIGKRVIHLFGWQETVKGRNRQTVCVLFEDTGQMHLLDRFRGDHAVFGKPVFREFELND